MTTMNDKKWNELKQAEDMACFRADLCCYSFEEKKRICNDMISSSKAVLDAMREDFQAYPPEFRSKLFAMICEAEPEKADWWWDILVGDGDPLHRKLDTI